jgi:uncharacterized protein YacL
MAFKIIRGCFVIAFFVMGAVWSIYIVPGFYNTPIGYGTLLPWAIVGGATGAALAGLILLLLNLVTQEIFERLWPAVMTIVLALVTGYVLPTLIIEFYLPDVDPIFKVFTICSFVLLFGFAGTSLGLTLASSLETLVKAVHSREVTSAKPKIVDTSVIIDGRIADVCKTGFIEGTLVIPQFVLHELQNIADSPDVLRRVRGRRGLDIVKGLQDPDSGVVVEVTEDDPTGIREVDSKLVRLAKDYDAMILTNDLNLNKVAQIEGISVLNLNDLANALKPAVLPDEKMEVKIIKEGKEALQGVGYLDDGTMVVVDGGRDFLGKNVAVLVTSVLQTSAGRMIFSKLQEVLS